MDSETGSRDSPEAWRAASASDLGSCVTQLINVLARGTARIAAERELTHVDCALLWRFLEVEEWTATLLARALPLSPSTISRTVQNLVHRGFVQRRRLLSDRRVIILTLTEEGLALTQDLHRRVQAYEAELCGNVSDEEMSALTSVTSKVMAEYAALA